LEKKTPLNEFFLFLVKKKKISIRNKEKKLLKKKQINFFFLSKKYYILKAFQNQSGVSKYRNSHTVITGLPQQRGNQSSQQRSQA
jgi:hypothetical protein